MDVKNQSQLIFDPIYGFIKLTPVEREIVGSPFYQRLRWIKQLGFSFYVFPGAEHSRFGHSIGAMHNAHHILKSCELSVLDEELMSFNPSSDSARYHQSLRLAALMHDLGTFPFSHTTEASYMEFQETRKITSGKAVKDDHENLGSFIIKNTNYEGGITYILEKHGIDSQVISDLVKGVDPSILANQILHSDIDCDRMDYLLRDAHYTGLKYGSYDRDYLLYHFTAKKVAGHNVLTIKHNALHSVEDFLVSRFAWYSQVIRSPRGARYDAIAEKICFYLLEKGYIYKYSDLLDMVLNDPLKFYGFNDNYFMSLVHQHYLSGTFKKKPDIQDMAHTLLLQKGAKVIKCDELNQRLLNQDHPTLSRKTLKKAESKVDEIKEILIKKGDKCDWIIADLPKKDIIFVKSENKIVKDKASQNILLERDPVKISYENGDIKLLAQVENSFISHLQKSKNYIPNVFCSESAYKILLSEGVVES